MSALKGTFSQLPTQLTHWRILRCQSLFQNATAAPLDAVPAPHQSSSTPLRQAPAPPLEPEFAQQSKLWRPRRVLITADAWQALRTMALAGYPVGLTIAPIMPVPQWQQEYKTLLTSVARAVENIDRLDMTAELITHRFTPGSKEVLLRWYPRTTLDLREEAWTEKRTKFGGFKYVYPKDEMGELRACTFFGLVRAQ